MKRKLILVLFAPLFATVVTVSAQDPPRNASFDRGGDQPVAASAPVPGPVAGLSQKPASPEIRRDDDPFDSGAPATTGTARVTTRAVRVPSGQNRSVATYQVTVFDDSSAEVAQLAHQLAAAKSDDERERLKSRLTASLTAQFEERQQRHEEELKALEDQVKKLRELVDKRKENRRDIIARRLEQIVRDSQGLGW